LAVYIIDSAVCLSCTIEEKYLNNNYVIKVVY